MVEVFNLVLPMDETDLKPHPHIVVKNDNKDFLEVFKVVSFKPAKHLLPPFKDLVYRLKNDCFSKESCINLTDVIWIEKNNYINQENFFWFCSKIDCSDCNKGCIVIKKWEEILKEIIKKRKQIHSKWFRSAEFTIETIMKYNPK